MDKERKKLEEIIAALPLVFLGKQSAKCQAEVAKRIKALKQAA